MLKMEMTMIMEQSAPEDEVVTATQKTYVISVRNIESVLERHPQLKNVFYLRVSDIADTSQMPGERQEIAKRTGIAVFTDRSQADAVFYNLQTLTPRVFAFRNWFN